VVQNMAGLTYMTGPKGRPLRAGSSVNDIMGGMFGAIGVLAALQERQRTGRGQEVQSALFENCCLLAAQHMQQFQMTGEPAPPMPSRVSAWSVYDVFTVRRRRAAVHRRGERQAVPDPVPRARPHGPGRGRGAGHQRAARGAAPELLKWLGDTLHHHEVSELSPNSKRPAFRTRRSCGPTSSWTTRT
jgi:hypothetical protein